MQIFPICATMEQIIVIKERNDYDIQRNDSPGHQTLGDSGNF